MVNRMRELNLRMVMKLMLTTREDLNLVKCSMLAKDNHSVFLWAKAKSSRVGTLVSSL